jgi:hypothetical protein
MSTYPFDIVTTVKSMIMGSYLEKSSASNIQDFGKKS